MLILLPIVVGLVTAIAWRQSAAGPERRVVLAIASLALAVRLAAVLVIYVIARQAHGEGTWLNDEASFFLATESLLPNPLDRVLPLGLDHLGGDGYLGLITVISMLFGAADTNAFRVVNAGLGTVVVVLCALQARRLFGPNAGLIAGVTLALWPTLVLWSATFLRDTLGSVAIVALWWMLGQASHIGRGRTLAAAFLALVLLSTLRPYLAAAAIVGVAVWAAYPIVRRVPRVALVGVAAATLAACAGVGVAQSRQLDFAAHELIYRQTVTRIETLGLLYMDVPPEVANLPIKPGLAVAISDQSGWLLTGVVQDVPKDEQVRIAFVDQSIRTVPVSEVMRLESAPIPPLQLISWVGPNLLVFLTGASPTKDGSSVVWVIGSLAWDVVGLLALFACVRARLSAMEWLFPLCVVGGTALALIAVPGAPGNADRHLSTQTLPLLVVFATALVARGASVKSIVSKPAKQPTAISSLMRSAR